jgi:hypothetical protein
LISSAVTAAPEIPFDPDAHDDPERLKNLGALDTEGSPAEGCPLPEVFLTADGPNDNTDLRIDLVYISKKAADRTWPHLDVRPIDQIRSLKDLADAFGPGTFQLIGRNGEQRQRNIRIVYPTIASASGGTDPGAIERAIMQAPPPARELDLAKIGGALAAIMAPLVALYEKSQDRQAADRAAEREAADRRAAEDRARDARAHETMMAVVTTALTSRNEDLRQMKSTAPAGDAATDAYKDGQADTIAMLKQAKEEGLIADGGEGQMLELVTGFIQGAQHAKARPKAAPPAMPPAAAPPELGGGDEEPGS